MGRPDVNLETKKLLTASLIQCHFDNKCKIFYRLPLTVQIIKVHEGILD